MNDLEKLIAKLEKCDEQLEKWNTERSETAAKIAEKLNLAQSSSVVLTDTPPKRKSGGRKPGDGRPNKGSMKDLVLEIITNSDNPLKLSEITVAVAQAVEEGRYFTKGKIPNLVSQACNELKNPKKGDPLIKAERSEESNKNLYSVK